METAAVDVIVIGAGVVGLACAERLARAGLATVVVERHARFGQETSSRNSGVVHAGMYYAIGSLKAELCVRGNRSLYAWCERHGVAHRRIGKYIVAGDVAGEAQLEVILSRGKENGVVGLRHASAAELAREEPNVIAQAALFSPETGIVDAHGLMASLLSELSAHGGALAVAHTLVGAARDGDEYALRFVERGGAATEIRAKRVVNAAGLDADRVAAMPGLDVDGAEYRQRFAKGSYFRLRKTGLVRRLVYPLPFAQLQGLGVHVTIELDGSARLGPDVEFLDERVQDYNVDEGRRDAFFAAASTYLRGIAPEDLAPDQAGIRPKLQLPGGPPRDFVIAEESARGLPRWVNLVGIESPGLTASLAIAERVAALVV